MKEKARLRLRGVPFRPKALGLGEDTCQLEDGLKTNQDDANDDQTHCTSLAVR